MIITKVDDGYLEIELEGHDRLRALQHLGISAIGVCKLTVTIVRQGLDYDDLHRKFLEDTRGGDSDDGQFECFDPDHT